MTPFFVISVAEIQKVQTSGKPIKDQKYVDIYREKPIKVAVKVLVPVREHPKVSFFFTIFTTITLVRMYALLRLIP